MSHSYVPSAAHQRELETAAAVPLSTEAMVTDRITCGSPIYEEIDSLHSLRNDLSEAISNDEDHVTTSTDTVEYVNNFPLPEESKVVQDKYETFPVSY